MGFGLEGGGGSGGGEGEQTVIEAISSLTPSMAPPQSLIWWMLVLMAVIHIFLVYSFY